MRIKPIFATSIALALVCMTSGCSQHAADSVEPVRFNDAVLPAIQASDDADIDSVDCGHSNITLKVGLRVECIAANQHEGDGQKKYIATIKSVEGNAFSVDVKPQ
jgi:hypothetical protein